MQIGSPLHIPPIANPRFTGILQPALGPETSCCVINDLFSAGDIFLADLANTVLLACLAVGAD